MHKIQMSATYRWRRWHCDSCKTYVEKFGAKTQFRKQIVENKLIGLLLFQSMLDEVDGPMNFTQMVTLFATKMAGGSDDDDVILASFEAFEQDGKIDAETFRAQLMTFGNKFSASEVDDAFAEFKIDDGQIDAAHLKGLMVSK